METKFNKDEFEKFKKKNTTCSKKFKAGIIAACALLGVGFITMTTLYTVSVVNKKDSGDSEKVAELTKQLDAKKVELAKEKEIVETKTKEIETLNNQIAELNVEIEKHTAEEAKLKLEKAMLETQLATAQADLKTANDKIIELNTTITNLEKQIAEEQNKIVVCFIDKDLNTKVSTKIAKDTTFEKAGIDVPDPTEGYRWFNFDGSTTKFTTHTVIHEAETGKHKFTRLAKDYFDAYQSSNKKYKLIDFGEIHETIDGNTTDYDIDNVETNKDADGVRYTKISYSDGERRIDPNNFEDIPSLKDNDNLYYFTQDKIVYSDQEANPDDTIMFVVNKYGYIESYAYKNSDGKMQGYLVDISGEPTKDLYITTNIAGNYVDIAPGENRYFQINDQDEKTLSGTKIDINNDNLPEGTNCYYDTDNEYFVLTADGAMEPGWEGHVEFTYKGLKCTLGVHVGGS